MTDVTGYEGDALADYIEFFNTGQFTFDLYGWGSTSADASKFIF
jgi:hypothetical protein